MSSEENQLSKANPDGDLPHDSVQVIAELLE